jgi:hypothetical protein
MTPEALAQVSGTQSQVTPPPISSADVHAKTGIFNNRFLYMHSSRGNSSTGNFELNGYGYIPTLELGFTDYLGLIREMSR